MTTLWIPLHLQPYKVENLMTALLTGREVHSVKVDREAQLLVITHDRKPADTGLML